MKSLKELSFYSFLIFLFASSIQINLAGDKKMLSRRLYLPAAGQNKALWHTVSYIDSQLTRREVLRTSSKSDAYFEHQQRISHDNGKTWSELTPVKAITNQLPGGGLVNYYGKYTYDSRLQILFQPLLRRLWPGMEVYTYNWGGAHKFVNQVFIIENGVERQLKYENGPDYDPENIFNPNYYERNRAYFGADIAIAENGTVFFPMVCYKHGEEYSLKRGGVVLMRRNPQTSDWLPSNQQYVSPEVSSRGLLEPGVALLKNGNLLIVCRGSNTKTTPGRKWCTLSTDGGKTLQPIREFKYDDGSRFYSPSSIHHFVRSSKNEKLYWLANIVETPPKANGSRYPLYLTEIDEDQAAVKKASLVLVDDRRENEPEKLQLSNFCVLENRETLDIEIYITRLGENPDYFWQGAVYQYLFSPE